MRVGEKGGKKRKEGVVVKLKCEENEDMEERLSKKRRKKR